MASAEAVLQPRERAGDRRVLLAWTTVAALFLAYIFSFIDRMIIGLLVEPIKADLGLSDTEISLLQGLAFAIFFTLAGLPIGRLIDRAHRMRTVAAGITVWSLMTAASGLATSFWQFFVARMGVGVGEAVLSPAAYSVISDSFDRRRLGLAMGIYGLGSAIGAGLAFMIGASVIALVTTAEPTVLPLVGEVRPWQLAFFFAGLPGLGVALLFLLLPEPPRGADHRAGPVPVREVGRHLAAHRGFFWSVFIGVSAVNLSVLGTVSWLPTMMVRSFGTDISSAGYLAGALLIGGGLIGMVGGGLVMDRLGGGTPAARMRFVAWATLAGVGFAAAFPLLPSLWGLGVAFLAFFSVAAATVGAAPSTIQQLSPGPMRGTISAVYVFVINIIGLGAGPTVTAVLGDQLFPFADGIRYAMAIVAPAGYALAALLFFVAARHAERAWRETAP
jgi:MFS family permease